MSNRLRQALRSATRDEHAAIDARMGKLHTLGTAGYGRMLLVHAQVLPAVEEALTGTAVAADLGDWPARRRTHALHTDLDELELARPQTISFHPPTGSYEAVGMLYVLEGSRLGGRVLDNWARRLPGCRQARAFLRHGHRERFWPIFLTWLARLDPSQAETGTAIAGSRRVFTAYQEVLQDKIVLLS